MSKYTVEYFVNKFDAIPEDKWTTGQLKAGDGCHCALGHCGVTDMAYLTDEAKALAQILAPVTDLAVYSSTHKNKPSASTVYCINDGSYLLGSHPKERIVNALTLAASGALQDV